MLGSILVVFLSNGSPDRSGERRTPFLISRPVQTVKKHQTNSKQRANRQLSCCFFALALAFGLLSLGFLRTLSVLFANPGSIAVGSLWALLFAPFRSLSLSFAPFWPPFAPFWSPLALFCPPLVNFCLQSLTFRTLFRPLWLS